MAKLPSHADLGLPMPPAGRRSRPQPTPMELHNTRHAARMAAILANKPPPPLPVYTSPRNPTAEAEHAVRALLQGGT
jgi:hypothetical protein